MICFFFSLAWLCCAFYSLSDARCCVNWSTVTCIWFRCPPQADQNPFQLQHPLLCFEYYVKSRLDSLITNSGVEFLTNQAAFVVKAKYQKQPEKWLGLGVMMFFFQRAEEHLSLITKYWNMDVKLARRRRRMIGLAMAG